MELVPSSSMSEHSRETCHKDEMFMQQSLKFSDSLKALKSLRKQLYSAAEYFESSDTTDEQKHILIETLKDYAIKALFNTVDHLGSIASKRIRSWSEFNGRQGLSQQSLIIKTPKHHQRYILPEVKIMDGQKASQYYRDDLHQPGTGHLVLCSVCDCSAGVIVPKTRGITSSSEIESCITSLAALHDSESIFISGICMTNILDKQKVHVQQAQLMHSRSLISRLPFQNSSAANKRYPSPPGKSNSLVYNAREKKKKNELEEYSIKTKCIFNALLSMH